MARSPNYKFERLERERAKAAKKASRLEAKKEKAEQKNAENAGSGPDDDGSVLSADPSSEQSDQPEGDDPDR
jgi:hypothetical protein